MSESATTVIKLLSALTSPKAAVKYLSVGLFLVASWSIINTTLKELGAPDEHLGLIALLLGLGMGSLVGHFVCFISSFILDGINKKRAEIASAKEQEESERKEQQIGAEKNERILEKFKKAYEHYDWWKRDILRRLTEGESCLEWGVESVDVPKRNGYIEKVVNVDGDKDIYKIHPAIIGYVSTQWREEINQNLQEFFSEENVHAESLLNLLEFREEKDTSPISQAILDPILPRHPCFEIEAEDEFGFYISIRYPYLTEFEKKTGVDYQDETFIDRERIVG